MKILKSFGALVLPQNRLMRPTYEIRLSILETIQFSLKICYSKHPVSAYPRWMNNVRAVSDVGRKAKQGEFGGIRQTNEIEKGHAVLKMNL